MNPDEPIYRLHRKQHLEQLLAGRLVLRSTYKWPDPWENLISLCGYEQPDESGKICQTFLDRNRFPTFAQSWTRLAESDALWRIYSLPGHRGEAHVSFVDDEAVQLRTTPGKLIEAFKSGMGAARANKCHIQDMNYLRTEELMQQIGNAIAAKRELAFSGISGHIEALLFKRVAFSHEKEVRLLYVDSDREFQNWDQIDSAFDVNDVIQEIVLDPRVRTGSEEEQNRTKWLRAQGFRNSIKTSQLYQGILIMVRLPSS